MIQYYEHLIAQRRADLQRLARQRPLPGSSGWRIRRPNRPKGN